MSRKPPKSPLQPTLHLHTQPTDDLPMPTKGVTKRKNSVPGRLRRANEDVKNKKDDVERFTHVFITECGSTE